DNYTKDAKQSVALKTGFDVGHWKPLKDFQPSNPLMMQEYLDDLQVRRVFERITEKALWYRPSNIIALAVDVVCGTDNYHLSDQERAAVSLQARQRGNKARQTSMKKTEEEERDQATISVGD
ncbi:MAG: hypothetical protein SGPRY_011894, partial [Prymnesium sp.]